MSIHRGIIRRNDMKQFVKVKYETPATEVWGMNLKNCLLEGSPAIEASRSTYGSAETQSWE